MKAAIGKGNCDLLPPVRKTAWLGQAWNEALRLVFISFVLYCNSTYLKDGKTLGKSTLYEQLVVELLMSITVAILYLYCYKVRGIFWPLN